ncbi:MAG: DEAD/DEAH box helicase [Bacteriovoracaceae bacterium]|nr:DEAD/DEAH box helicase [Bacteriovoracaceae bacterium]
MQNTETEHTFKDYNLNPELLKGLEQAGFNKPSPIQEMTIKPILEGKDIFAQAETGSGKTGSFAIPILEDLAKHKEEFGDLNGEPLYLVMSPTRELAQQTDKVFKEFGEHMGITTVCLIGGESIQKQKDLLAKNPHVLVGTPGRIKDLLKQKSTSLAKCKGVVFDEADRLFDMGFQKDVEDILSQAPNGRQLIMVSATSNQEVLRLAYKFRSHPVELRINTDDLLVDNIDHKLAIISSKEKMPLLVKMLRDHENTYAIVFCNTQIQTHVVAEWLRRLGFPAKPISGALSQNKRTRLMQEFRDKEVTILVCTDVAARGLDIKDVNLVINYDLPQDPSNYVHRIGRTGRAGKEGQAISLCGYEDCEFLDSIYEYIDSKIPKMDLSDEDFAHDIGRRPRIDKRTLQVIDENSSERGPKRPDRGDKRRDEKRGPREERAPRADKAPRKDDKKRPERVEHKDFDIEGYSFEDAQKAALKHFDVKDKNLLASKVLEEGKKKFFLFGPKLKKFRFYTKPLKRLVLPFLIETLKLAKLDLYVSVHQSRGSLDLVFKGKDLGLLLTNRKQLLRSFETLTQVFLQDKLRSAKNIRIQATVEQQKDDKQQEDDLIQLVEKTKTRIKQTRRPVVLKRSLNPAERRIIHKSLEDSGFISESLGEGRMKKIKISQAK